jgi:hypothetical protein
MVDKIKQLSIKDRIIIALESKDEPSEAGEISRELNENINTIWTSLFWLKRSGTVARSRSVQGLWFLRKDKPEK